MVDYDLIIFDCDGTLVNSELLCNNALLEVIHDHGVDRYDIDYALNHWAGKTMSNVLAEVTEETGVVFPQGVGCEYVRKCNERYSKDMIEIEGALDTVTKLSKITKICVGSNGQRDNVFRSLELCGFIPDLFTEESIFTKIQVEHGKPAPDLFLLAAGKMGAVPEKCLVVEDSITGVRAGVAAGMEVWGFTGVSHDPESQAEALKKHGASHIFSSFIHMGEMLGI